ncbi:MAG: hypothetical protein WBP64_08290 [Nitrososphaeraceae archaeon]
MTIVNGCSIVAFVGLLPIVGAFAAANSIAGNLTIFGAASNIIIIEAAEFRGA